jgi:hypothetical protein
MLQRTQNQIKPKIELGFNFDLIEQARYVFSGLIEQARYVFSGLIEQARYAALIRNAPDGLAQ